MSLEFKEELKVYSKVLDDLTIKALVELRNRKIIFGLVKIIKEGKESVVFLGKDFEKNYIAIKIYRIYHSDFKMIRNLLALDPRYERIKRGKRNIVFYWCNREYRNLKLAYEKAKVNCPKPIASYQNILIMEFLGENEIPYPLLKDIELDHEIAKNFYNQVIENLKRLKKIGLVHGDLSEHNILVGNDKIYLIDFSHGVKEDSIIYEKLFRRDLENINRFFSKFLSEDELVLEI
ncbi:MAG: serine protein kinase RIO [Candidatus Aenigmatarchaeota archaeon]